MPRPSSTLRAAIAETRTAERERELKGEIASLRRQLTHAVTALERARGVSIPRIPKARLAPRLRGDRVRILAGDLHGCKCDRPTVAAFLADVKAIAPHEVILGGDIVDCGGFLAQHHTLGYVAETDYTYEEDVAAANDFLNRLQQAAPRALVEQLEGNHERRVETWCVTQTLRHCRDAELLRRALAPEHMLKLKARGIPYYRLSECYDGLTVPGVIRRGSVLILHGITTGRHAASLTALRTSANTVFFHTHRAQSDIQRRVGVGIIGAWNPGCLCGLQPLWQHGSPTDWTNGYALEFVSRTGKFLHLNVPIINGTSLLTSLFKR